MNEEQLRELEQRALAAAGREPGGTQLALEVHQLAAEVRRLRGQVERLRDALQDARDALQRVTGAADLPALMSEIDAALAAAPGD